MPFSMIRAYLHDEAVAALVLLAASALALGLANSPLAPAYASALATHAGFTLGALKLDKSLAHWIGDGLMTLFFLTVGLEIKREVLKGELASWRRAALPGIAAVGGMVAPALVYVAFNLGDAAALSGWAIPAATDIAFAVGVLALAGAGVPPSLRIFLLALAIMDDLGAIVVIAVFYTQDVALTPLAVAVAALIGLILLNRAGARRLAPYLGLGVVLWLAVLESGVHATLAGVALAFTIPLSAAPGAAAPARRLEKALHPWVAFGVLPIFALANAGVPLAGVSAADLLRPIPLGIALGLFAGKQVGVMLAALLAVRFKLASLPRGVTWRQFHAVAVLTGVGFTMSLFIGTLAFDEAALVGVRLGVLAGSLVSALVGYALLAGLPARKADRDGGPNKAARQPPPPVSQ